VTLTGCGDGVTCGIEACDDGNTVTCGTSCAADCSGPITGCGDHFICGTEVCDATNLNGQTCATLSYPDASGTLACAANCQSFNMNGCVGLCGNNTVDSTYEACDGTALAGKDCGDFGTPSATGTLTCMPGCNAFNLSGCVNTCGNNSKDPDEVCDGTDLVSSTCASFRAGATGSLSCLPDCSGFDFSACTNVCGDGTIDVASGELCDSANLDAKDCTSVGLPGGPFVGGSLSCANNCQSFVTTACYRCGDGTRNGNELCDGNDMGVPAASCQALGFSDGTLTCNGTCDGFITTACTRCGDGTINSGEPCDSNNLNGKSCTSPGLPGGPYEGGTLACNGNCTDFDASGCDHCDATACATAGGTCANGTCACDLYGKLCNGSCVNTRTDPNNCGDCGIPCTGGTACSAGKCMETCQAPLTKCSGRCIDIATDNTHCGGCPGTTCTGGAVCVNGSCAAPAATVTTPAKCVNGGPAIDLNLGTTTPPVTDPLACTGDMASVSFRWAICSCTNIATKPVLADGFNSSDGPYDPRCENGSTPCTSDANCSGIDTDGDALTTCAGQLGAGIGANGIYENNQTTRVWGTLWWEDASAATLSTATVRQNLQCGGDLPGVVRVEGDTSVVGNINASGYTHHNLYSSLTSSKAAGFTVTGTWTKGPGTLDVKEPCDCSSGQLINVVDIVSAHASRKCASGARAGWACSDNTGCPSSTCVAVTTPNNDNAAAGLNPDVLKASSGRLDLPCGMYYLSEITGGGTATIYVDGRTAIFVGGNIDAADLIFQLSDSAELDIFVLGALSSKNFRFGSPNFPARARLYIAGGSGGASGAGGSGIGNSGGGPTLDDAIYMPQTAKIAGNIYAPWGGLDISQDLLMYGGLFIGKYGTPQSSTVHFDTGVVDASETCPGDCGNDRLDGLESCDGELLGGATCQTQGFDGGTLLCTADCKSFDTSHCYRCGDCTVNGSEMCDKGGSCGAAVIPTSVDTCAELGFDSGTVSCRADCRLDTSGCQVCGNGIRETGEQCEVGNLGGATCLSVGGGFSGGVLSCNASTCQFDTSRCTACGDGSIQTPEQCEPGNLGGSTCESLGFAGGTLLCNPDLCRFDTSRCTRVGVCGNGLLEAGEACDDQNSLDTDNCRNDCTRPVCGDRFVSSSATEPWIETCDSDQLNGQSCGSLGLGTGTLACDGSCQLDTSGCHRCGDGVISTPSESCEPGMLGAQTCQSLGYSGGTLSCGATNCQFDVSACSSCGDCALQAGELCDKGGGCGAAVFPANSDTCSEVSAGFTGGTLSCNGDCTVNTTACFGCGDGTINGSEQCDGEALAGQTCVSRGFTGGTLMCNGNCTFNTSGCFNCGDCTLNADEECDKGGLCGPAVFPPSADQCTDLGFTGGSIGCNSNCTLNTAGCTSGGSCGDCNLDAGEQCDKGGGCGAATFPTSQDTCQELGYDGGSLTCSSNCGFNTAACFRCGDNVKNGTELCDGADVGTATCASLGQGFTGGTLGCTAACTYDTSACSECSDCRDCNNQACIAGLCGACSNNADCCSPLVCFFGECVLF